MEGTILLSRLCLNRIVDRGSATDLSKAFLGGPPRVCGSGSRSSPSAIGRDALVGYPHALGQLSGLPEHVDRDTAARIPVAADAQPFRLDRSGDPLADHDRAVLVERAVIAE